MGSIDHDVRRRMDELAMKNLELMDDILTCRSRLDNLLKDGFIDMAKARYNMGNHSVSVLQLPTEESDIEAKRRVCTKTLSDNVVTPFTEFSLELVSHGACEPQQENRDQNVLRKRNIEETSTSKDDEFKMKDLVNESGADKSNKRKDLRHKDPLLWFGVLVPANLRESQKSFQKAISITCELATLQSELYSVEHEFCKLRKQKLVASKICEDSDNTLKQNTYKTTD